MIYTLFMSAQQYLPSSDNDRVIWLNNMNAALPQFAGALGLSVADLQILNADAVYFAFMVQYQNDLRQHLQAITQFKNNTRSNSLQSNMGTLPVFMPPTPPPAVPAGIFNRVATLVLRIKRAPGYTAAIGQALNIIPPVVNFNPAAMTPELTGRLDAGRPQLRWKKGEADGVVIYVDRRDGNGFVQLVHTVKTAYIDAASLPANAFGATWDYKAIYFIGDDEVGNFSQVISINVFRTA